jgi:SAM-dependent methyltransferase
MTMNDRSPQDQVFETLVDFWATQAVYAAAHLGLADYLAERPRSAAQLAAVTRTHAPSLARLLRALSAAGWLRESAGRYDLTPLGQTLRTGAGSMRSLVLTVLGGEHYRAWGGLLHSLRTGRPAFEHVFGRSIWDFYADHPEQAATFNDAMTAGTAAVAPAVLEAFDFSPFRTVVDVGGGHGGFLAGNLEANPNARGVVFDAPHVVAGARGHLAARGLAGRCEAVGGDFFESVPVEGDLYVLKWIIHDWDDQRALRILRSCRRAVAPGGRLLLVEFVLTEDGETFGPLVDLDMLVMAGGKERTEGEFRSLLAEAGFTLTAVRPTRSRVSLVEAGPAPGGWAG